MKLDASTLLARSQLGDLIKVPQFSKLFTPDFLQQHQREMLANAAREYKRYLKYQFPDQVINKGGPTRISPELLAISEKIGEFIKQFHEQRTVIKLPNENHQQAELTALFTTLYESIQQFEGAVRFVAPVCPDYSQGSADQFYQSIGQGVSPQAAAAVRAAKAIETVCEQVGFTPQIDILLADTEDDLPEVMDRCVAGDTSEYSRRCQESVAAIDEQATDLGHTSVTTFTGGLGDDFRHSQYAYENVIQQLRLSDPKVADEVERMGEQRSNRHSKILGRPEQDYELTVRYMAQYAALGTLMRELNEPVVLVNYPTPNLPFFNAAVHRSPEFSLSEADQQPLPVVTSVL